VDAALSVGAALFTPRLAARFPDLTHQGLSAEFVKENSTARLFLLLIQARLAALVRLPRMLAKRRQIRNMRTISVREWYGLISRFKLDAIELALKF
jgi:hypothetical protein